MAKAATVTEVRRVVRRNDWSASAAKLSARLFQPRLFNFVARETIGLTRTLGAGALVDRVLGFFANRHDERGAAKKT